MACGFFFGNAKDARADGWVINGGAAFLMDQWNVVSEEYVFGDKTYYGVIIDFQPEYRFTKWFGLGIDLGLGGGVGDTGGWERASSKMGIGVFQAFLTAKFIGDFKLLDLWLELGAGGVSHFGEFILDDGEWEKFVITGSARVRAGITFDINENIGLGVHAGWAWRILEDWNVEAGFHFTYHYGK